MNAKLRTPLAVVRGLGSAKAGTEHWWVQRLTSVALVPLTLIFMGIVLGLVGESHAAVAATLGRPWPATITILLVAVSFWHLKLGGQVVIEDYVEHEGAKLVLIVLLTFLCVAVALACILSVLRLVAGA